MKQMKLLAGFVAVALAGVAALAEDVRVLAKTFTAITESAPRDMKLREFKFREAGLTATPYFQDADEIRIFSTSDTSRAPETRIWLNSSQSNAYWFHKGGTGSAEEFVVKKGQAVLIHARALTKTVLVPKPE